MRDSAFLLKFIILLVAQVLIWNFCNFSQYAMLTFLPVIILLLPTKQETLISMLIAFAAGFLVDFLADGMLGLTSLALVPVAFLRKGIIRLVFGSELLSREENISLRKHGASHIIVSTLLCTAIFLAVYIWADGAGMRPLWFNLVKFGASLLLSSIVSVFLAIVLFPDEK